MKVVRLDRRARLDLREIWRYTAKTWDVRQADKYLAAINDAIAHLADERKRATNCDWIKRGYSRTKSGSHFLFMRFAGDEIHIARILHERMNFAAHLG